MATGKKASPAQIAARKLFVERVKAGEFSKSPAKRKTNPVKKSTARYVVLMGTPGKIIALDLTKAVAVKIAKHKNAMMGVHTVVENGDTGEVVYDSAPWYKKNPVAKIKYTDRAKELRSDAKTAYAVHLAAQPSYNAIAYYSKKADALEVAQEAADRTGKQLAVTRIQIYFGE